uniref:Uncharacterized protein n=1 Tax=Arcella intermedia TaxID=1963864 RepID=A0A6B2LLB0_9EUKA
MRDIWIRSGEYFIFCFSLIDKASFGELDAHIENIKRVKDIDYCPMIMVGCKADLETERQVTPEMIQNKVKEYNLTYFETSAMNNNNIQVAIETAMTNLKKIKEEIGFKPKPRRIVHK